MKKNYRRGDIGRFLATRTKKLTETTNLVETKISEPKEQIKAWLRSLPGSMSAWSERDEIMRDAIRRLIENMAKGPEVGKEFIDEWAGEDMEAQRFVENILLQAGVRVKEKEGGGE